VSACDTFFKVQGEVKVGDSSKPCDLTLYNASNGSVKDKVHIEGNFTQTFQATWIPKEYYVVVTCEGVMPEYRSKTFQVGYGRYYDEPLKLGRITLGERDR